MIPNWKKICVLAVFLTATANISAQSNIGKIHAAVSKILLKKDLRQAIKEAESASANDLPTLLWRLNLYQRAAHYERVVPTVRQILGIADPTKSFYSLSEHVLPALKDPLFKDAQTLQLYLQFDFNGDIYGKFVDLCLKNREICNINDFDKWLERKAEESSEKNSNGHYFFGENNQWTWVARRIDWRERSGLDNGAILNGFAENVRNDPSDLNAARRYLRFFRSVQDREWLAETFASEQAYDYYELGETLSRGPQQWQMSENERTQTYQIASRFLQKSLSLPFNEKDIDLMWSRRFMHTSIPPVIKNHEKQLRFWTKTELAEVLKNIGRSQDAQPIVEELMNLDTSDIISYKPSQLAGAVQAASGARAVESKILLDEATRRTTYEYWYERIAYYQGRKEPERIFDAYLHSFAAVPFDLSKKESGETRLFYIRRFAYFAKDEYGYCGNSSNRANFDDEEKQKLRLWGEAENFLRNEFERTRSNIRYSYELAETISQNRFEKLSHEILSRNPEILVNAAHADLVTDMDNLLYVYFNLDIVSQEKKDSIAGQILKIAEKKNVEKAWVICEALADIDEQPDLARRIVPILVKNLKIVKTGVIASKSSDGDHMEREDLRNKYLEVLFDTYLSANDWRSAERLLMEQYSRFSSLDSLILNAAKNGADDDAVRYWKLKSNLDRRNLDNLSSMMRFPTVAESLRHFYKQMKTDEPYSPVPDIALGILK